MAVDILENRADWETYFRANWLAHFQATGEVDWKRYQRIRNRTAPTSAGVDLARARLLFITSSGAYLAAEQTPYDADNDLGDYTIRPFPTMTPLDQLAYAHTHYDHAAVDADPQVLVPLDHLRGLVAEGVIGALTETSIAFMGYQPDAGRTVDELIPALLTAARATAPDAAFLVPS